MGCMRTNLKFNSFKNLTIELAYMWNKLFVLNVIKIPPVLTVYSAGEGFNTPRKLCERLQIISLLEHILDLSSLPPGRKHSSFHLKILWIHEDKFLNLSQLLITVWANDQFITVVVLDEITEVSFFQILKKNWKI